MSFTRRFHQLLVLPLLMGAACDGATDVRNGRVFGPEVQLGNGVARAFIQLENGKPDEVGVELSEAALTGLPPGGDHVANAFVLDMPSTNASPFEHVLLNWNPAGHEPPGIYDIPHFDFHFYLTPSSARMAIMPTDPEFHTKAAKYPAQQFIPAGYISPAPEAVPMMGVHWIDPTSPELNGQIFTRTFIYGSWNGDITFLEPMITKAFIESKPNSTFSIPIAARYAVPGYYPESYQVRFNATTGRHEIVLTGLEFRN